MHKKIKAADTNTTTRAGRTTHKRTANDRKSRRHAPRKKRDYTHMSRVPASTWVGSDLAGIGDAGTGAKPNYLPLNPHKPISFTPLFILVLSSHPIVNVCLGLRESRCCGESCMIVGNYGKLWIIIYRLCNTSSISHEGEIILLKNIIYILQR